MRLYRSLPAALRRALHAERPTSRAGRWRPAARVALLVAVALTCAAGPPRAQAQATDNAEARAFFDQGNRAFERSLRVEGARRTALLEEALAAYVASLAIVRSKNALFNAGVTLTALGRHAEAYAYFGEYQTQGGLSPEEQQAADTQRLALTRELMMTEVRSTPPGAEVRVDRPDLVAVGRTPLVVPLMPGEHVLLLRAEGYEDAALVVVARAGTTGEAVAVMVPVEGVPAQTGPGAEGTQGPDPQGGSAGAPRPGDGHRGEPPNTGEPSSTGEPPSTSEPPSTGVALERLGARRSPAESPALRGAAWGSSAALGLGALALRLRAGRLTREHDRLASDPQDAAAARAQQLYSRIERANRASQALTAAGALAAGVSLGLSLRAVRARRARAARLRLSLHGDLTGLSLGVVGVLP